MIYQYFELEIIFIFFGLLFFALFSIPLPKGWKQKLIRFIQTTQFFRYVFAFGTFFVSIFAVNLYLNIKQGNLYKAELMEYRK